MVPFRAIKMCILDFPSATFLKFSSHPVQLVYATAARLMAGNSQTSPYLWQQGNGRERASILKRLDCARVSCTVCCDEVTEEYCCVSKTHALCLMFFASAARNCSGIPARLFEAGNTSKWTVKKSFSPDTKRLSVPIGELVDGWVIRH